MTFSAAARFILPTYHDPGSLTTPGFPGVTPHRYATCKESHSPGASKGITPLANPMPPGTGRVAKEIRAVARADHQPGRADYDRGLSLLGDPSHSSFQSFTI